MKPAIILLANSNLICSQWRNPDFDDSNWLYINPTGYWDYLPELADYDGYGWYRIKVFIPSSLKEAASDTDSLFFRLGRVDDNDHIYLL